MGRKKKLSTLKIEDINVQARCLSDGMESEIQECIQLSFEKQCKVNYFINNDKFVIDGKLILNRIYKTRTATERMD